MSSIKTIYFVSGLPRSGATLFSAIINQNPKIYSSPQTDLVDQMNMLINSTNNSTAFISGQLKDNYLNSINKFPQNFYEPLNSDIIFDKNFKWGLPEYFETAKTINPVVKILCFYRPLLEVLTSFIIQCGPEIGNNFIDNGVKKEGYLDIYNNLNEARCEWLMGPNGTIPQSIKVMNQSVLPNNEIYFLNIAYQDLVMKPEREFKKIYKFFNLPEFEHLFNNIEYIEPNRDKDLFGLPNLHEVRPEIKKRNYDWGEILPGPIIEKYKNL
jgi:sulfotransferase